MVFMVSDFFDDKNYRQALKVAGRKHDCIAVTLSDQLMNLYPVLGTAVTTVPLAL